MKKIFFIFFLIFLEFRFSSLVIALDPIIINKSEKAYPPSFGNDQDYIPSDPSNVDTTTYTKTVNLSQSFSPVCSGTTDSTGSCNYTSQTIDDVKQKISWENFTNWGLRNIYDHLSHFVTNPTSNADDRMTAFKNYDLNNPLGSGNFTLRGLSSRDFLCALSRKIDNVANFINGGEASCIDEEVVKGKNRFSEVILTLNKIDLTDIIGTKNFYYPNCQADTDPTPLPGSVVTAFSKKFKQTPDNPVALFQNVISPMCTSSLASKVTQCDLDSNNNEKCKPSEKVSLPLGGGAPSAKNIMAFAVPANTSITSKDYSQTTSNNPIPDRPNPTFWEAVYTNLQHFWNDVLSDNKTFNGPTIVKYSLDNRVKDGLDTDQYAMTQFIPNDLKTRSNVDNANPSSATNNQTIDPGYSDNQTRQVLYKTLTPCSWQPGCQM